MTDAAIPHRHRDPILDGPPKRKKMNGLTLGIFISAALHLAAGAYLYGSRFKLKELNYEDEAVDVER